MAEMPDTSVDQSPIERAIAALNITAVVRDIAGEQDGVLGDEPFYVVTNPVQVVIAVLEAIREPSEAMRGAVGKMLADKQMFMDCGASDVWQAMIDALIAEAESGE